MEHSTSFLSPAPLFPPAPPLSSISESQLINNLNSSIEDLLFKISQVTEDYETSTLQLAHSSSQQPLTPIRLPRPSSQHTSKQKFKSKQNQCSDGVSTQISSKESHNKFQEVEQSDKLCVPGYFKSITLSSTKQDCRPPMLQDTGSLKLIQNPFFEEDCSFKTHKIHSLFTDTSIKEVAESRIFSSQEGIGSCEELQKNVRKVKGSMIGTTSQVKEAVTLSLRDFELGKCVGSGKFGEVYICRHRITGFLFALKKIFKSTISEYKMQSQFLLEMKILYMLDHPNIVKLYGHFCDEYHLFLLMEFVEGGQLMTRLKSNEEYVSRVVDQLIDAVAYIHDKRIVHRDIKPENIVMSFDNTPKLCDFGWAGEFDSKALKTTFCGTLDYVSPQMKDKGKYTSKVDLWSLGVLTFELLTGVAPLRDEISQWRKRGAHRNTQWDWHILYPTDISGLSETFMRHLLRENPDERASLRFCKDHFFIRKYREPQSQIPLPLHL